MLKPIDFDASPNFEKDRRGENIEAIVLHVTEGNSAGAIEWCKNEESKVSYHYIIKEHGEIVQMVEDKDTAWHAGFMKDGKEFTEPLAPNPNLKTLGIAYAGFAEKGPSFEQLISIADLIRHLSVIHSIPIDRSHILAHADIRTDKVCPGPHVNFEAIFYLCSLT